MDAHRIDKLLDRFEQYYLKEKDNLNEELGVSLWVSGIPEG